MTKLEDVEDELKKLKKIRCDIISCDKCKLRKPLGCKAIELQEEIWSLEDDYKAKN